jgi:hypothetical protein
MKTTNLQMKDVTGILDDIARERINDWLLRGYIEVRQESFGTLRKINRFDFFDCLVIRIFDRLLKRGFSRPQASMAVKTLGDLRGEILNPDTRFIVFFTLRGKGDNFVMLPRSASGPGTICVRDQDMEALSLADVFGLPFLQTDPGLRGFHLVDALVFHIRPVREKLERDFEEYARKNKSPDA